jgi:hypothetical protein
MTEMLVPPIRDRKGLGSDLSGCIGAKMEDGTDYRANRAGVMQVDNPHHVRAMKRDPAIAGDIVERSFHTRTDAAGRPGRYCTAGCITELQPWTHDCPRCGAPTEPRTDG